MAAPTEEVSVSSVPDSPENEAACLCGQCPSKTEDGLRFYCVRGQELGRVGAGLLRVQLVPSLEWIRPDASLLCDMQAGEDEAGLRVRDRQA